MLGGSYDKVAVKRTRKELEQKVRNDWDQVLLQIVANGTRANPQNLTRPSTDVLEWRERTYASSDPSSTESSESEDSVVPYAKHARLYNPAKVSSSLRTSYSDHHCMHPDGSDVDGDTSPGTDSPREHEDEARRKQDRKRRRRKRIEEEMTWNQGLSNWERTRDLWCCARRVSVSEEASSSSSLGTSASSRTDSATTASLHDKEEPGASNTSSISPETLPSALKALPLVRIPTTLIPITIPLIPPTDPGRRYVTSQYQAIYSKVVVESIAPQVPINLSHLVPALVQGWKDNDEWPPKPSVDAVKNATVRAKGGKPSQVPLVPVLGGSMKARRKGDGRNSLVIETGKRLLGHGSSKKSTSEGKSPSSPRTSESNGERERESPLQVRKHVARFGQALKNLSPSASSPVDKLEG